MEWYELWFIMRLDALQASFRMALITGVLGMIGIPFLMAYHDNKCISTKAVTKIIALLVVWFLVGIFGTVVTPTTKQAAIIFIVPKLTSQENMEFATDEAKELYGLAKQYLQETIKSEGESPESVKGAP